MMRKILIIPWLACTLAASPPQLAASDLIQGGKLYSNHCARCHGPSGKSVMAGVPDFNRPDSLLQSDKKLLARIQSGNKACPAYRGILSEQQIFDVIAYIRSLGLQ